MKRLSMVMAVGLMAVGSVQALTMDLPVTKDSSYRAGSGWPAGWYGNYAGTIRVSYQDSSYFYADLPTISLSPGESVQINSVTLNYFVYGVVEAPSSVTVTDQAFRISNSWAEGPAVGDNPGGWDTTTAPPTTAEGYGSYTLAGVPVSDLTGWKSIDITALVQGWMDGTYPNYGVAVRQTGGDWALQELHSLQNANGPYFHADFSIVPEPVTMVLVCVGGLGVARRKNFGF